MRTPAAVMLLFMLAPAEATRWEPPTPARQTGTASVLQTGAAAARQAEGAPQCGASGTAHVRTTLYFGLTRPTGTVSEAEWRTFVRDQVTPRFPDDLTVWEAEGQ